MGRISVETDAIARVLRWGTATGEPDGLLLARFLADRDEGAFAALVDRHGPMVLGVCRRVLRDGRDVEDAFQATFLLLARRGGTIRRRERVGPWLHGVAHRVAVRARAASARRFVREGAGLDAEPPTDAPPGAAAERGELRSILDEELDRLPGRLRDPLVLCHLEGLTHDQAAAALRQPVGTIRSRLSRGRDKLRARLARRGLSADDARIVPILAHPVSTALLESTLRSALAFTCPSAATLASAGAAVLAKGALDAMIATKAKLAAVALGTMLTLGGASGYALQQGGGGTAVSDLPENVTEPKPGVEETPIKGPPNESLMLSIRQYLADLEATLPLNQKQLAGLEEEQRTMLQKLHGSAVKEDALRRSIEAMLEGRAAALQRLEGLTQRPAEDTYATKAKRLPKPAGPVIGPRTEARLEIQKQVLELLSKNKELLEGADFDSIQVELEGINVGSAPSMQPPDEVKVARQKAGRTDRGSAVAPTQPSLGTVPFNVTHQEGKRLYHESPKMIIVASKDGHVVTGYSSETGEAHQLRLAPEGSAAIRVTPYLGMSMAALYLRGESIGRVAVFSSTDGEWHPHDLVEPTEEARPIIGPAATLYQVGRRLYAFSFMANKWDVLELPAEVSDQPYLNPETITLQSDGKLHIFSGRTGKWTAIDVSDAAEVPSPKFMMGPAAPFTGENVR